MTYALEFILDVQFAMQFRVCAHLLPDRLIAIVGVMTHTADHSASLANDALDRATQLLGMAREQLERAQGGAGAHLEDALVEADRRRSAWFPTDRAA